MNHIQILLAGAYFTASTGALFSSYLAYRNRGSKTTNSLLLTTLSGFLFIFAASLVIISSSRSVMAFGMWMLRVGYWAMGFGFALFTLHITGYYGQLTKRVLSVVYGVYLSLIALSATSPLHNLIILDYGINHEPFTYLYSIPSKAFPVVLGLGYLANFAIAVTLTTKLLTSSRVSRRQFLVPTASILASSVLFTIEYLIYEPAVGVGPIGLGPVLLLGGLTYIAFQEDLTKLNPISRKDVVSSITQPIIITNSNCKVVDYNDAAESIFPQLEGNLGASIESISPDLIDSRTDSAKGLTFVSEYTTTAPNGEYREYQVSTEDVYKGGEYYGKTLVLSDITKIKINSQNLEQQTDQLEDLTSFVSHDLRNPIASSQQFLDMVEGKNAQEQQYINNATESLDRMNTMIEELLTLTRKGQAIEERETVYLKDIVEYAWKISDTQEVILNTESIEGATLYANKNRLYTLFENLFRNIADHGGENTSATVGLLSNQNGFYVSDNGTGLPDDIDIFEKGSSTSENGTGLGLAIANQITEAHGWEIKATESKSGGAQFIIRHVKSLQRHSTNEKSDSKNAAHT
jgi:signal transduction histidine kinase